MGSQEPESLYYKCRVRCEMFSGLVGRGVAASCGVGYAIFIEVIMWPEQFNLMMSEAAWRGYDSQRHTHDRRCSGMSMASVVPQKQWRLGMASSGRADINRPKLPAQHSCVTVCAGASANSA
eukprot:scaffold149309_cov27-Prasinocladus_malaysianus.AAC.1